MEIESTRKTETKNTVQKQKLQKENIVTIMCCEEKYYAWLFDE